MHFDRETLNKLYSYGYALTRDKDNAYDLLHTCLEKFLSKNTSVENPSAYLRKMMRNQFIDDCRRAQKIAFEPLCEASVTDLSDAPLEKTMIESKQIEQVVNHLNSGERESLYLWAVQGYSVNEIVAETKEPRGTILSRLYRIRKKALKILMPDAGPTAEPGGAK